MTAEHVRYVQTKAAQAAVRDREVEILHAVGIDWREGRRDHIDCPFPGHGGAKDWRWDARQHKAFCTCGKKTFSIFDVVSEVEGADFDQSKIRCVEILGATDLIRTKGGKGQATDAASLLNAPADRRDDRLPRAYLAHRLGIEASAVRVWTSSPAS